MIAKSSARHQASRTSVPAPRKNAQRRRRATRAEPEERQQAILKAALDVFSEKGFAATRLEDIAHQAGVAKGTLYLYFPDKEALFESMLQSVAAPVLARLAALAADEALTPVQTIDAIIAFFETEFIGTPRENVVRLIISEGPRFPAMAKFHYDNVVSKGLASIRAVMKRAKGPASARFETMARFPQLVFAPFLISIVWRSLFTQFEPLDVPALLAAYKSILVPSEEEA